MSMNERSDRDFRERRDVMISREIPLNQELLASFSGRGRRRLRDLKQATETVLKLDRAKSCLQVRGTERSIADLRRHLETLIGHRRCVSAGAWAELMRTRTVIDSSEAAIQHIQEESGCRVHIERTTQEVRLYGPEQSLKVADRLLKELTEETDVQQVEGMLSPELLEQVTLRQGVTLRMRETCIEVLGRKAATRAAAAELEKLIKDPTTKTEHVGISAHVGVRSQSPKSFEAPLRVKSSRPDRQGSNQTSSYRSCAAQRCPTCGCGRFCGSCGAPVWNMPLGVVGTVLGTISTAPLGISASAGPLGPPVNPAHCEEESPTAVHTPDPADDCPQAMMFPMMMQQAPYVIVPADAGQMGWHYNSY